MKLLDIVWIAWRDALGSASTWESIDDLLLELAGERDIMESVGIFIAEDKRYVTITRTVQYDREGDAAKAGGTLSIPVGAIIEMKKVNEMPRMRRRKISVRGKG